MARTALALLAFDAFVDSSLYAGGAWAKESYAAFSAFMDRFHVAGLRRVLTELASETLTLGIGAGLVALTLAVPAFQETSDDWLKKEDLAVTFLDRYGQEVGRRGIKHDDSVSFDELPENLIEAVLATEDRRFFDHFGVDVIGTLRALTVNARADTVVQGGSTITQQLAKNIFLSNKRTLERKIKEAYLAVWLEFRLPKKRDPAALFRSRLSRRRRLRGAGRLAILFRQIRARSDARRGRDDRRPVQGADEIRAACQSAGGARARPRTSSTIWSTPAI